MVGLLKYDFWIRLFVVLLSFLQPFILIWSCGELDSISSYWETPLQPLFIFTNAVTSYFFFTMNRWRYSSLGLLLLTAFSVTLYPTIHNIVAISFFLSCLYPLYKTKRFKYYIGLYSLSFIVLLFFGILWAEIFGIIILTAYHTHMLLYKRILDINRSK